MRGPLRAGSLAFALMLVQSTLVSAQTYTFERAFAAGTAARLDISTHRGHIVVAASDDGRVVVSGTVTVRRSGFNMPLNAGELASGVADRPPVELRGTTLQIGPPGDPLVDRAVTVDYDIRVPPPLPIVAVSDSGSVTIKEHAGAVSVRTQTGAIDATVADAGGITFEATSESGTIDVAAGLVDGPVEKTRVRGTVRGGGAAWQLVTKTGAIRVRAPV
jgi:hypothetical protein